MTDKTTGTITDEAIAELRRRIGKPRPFPGLIHYLRPNEDAFRNVLKELREQYAVGYYPNNAKGDGRSQLKPVQPHQLGIASEIIDFDEVGLGVAPVKYPPDMTVQKAFVPG